MIKVTAEAHITALNYALTVLDAKRCELNTEMQEIHEMLNDGNIAEHEFFEKGAGVARAKHDLMVAINKILRVRDSIRAEAKGE